LVATPESVGAARTADIAMVDASSDIFVATIDIRTETVGGEDSGDYTALVRTELKGNLIAPALVVVRVPGTAPALEPGSVWLFFARFKPESVRYVVINGSSALVPLPAGSLTPADQRYWAELIRRSACPATDILVWDSVVYARRDWNMDKHYVPRQFVGPSIGRVTEQNTAATACSADLSDGTASHLATGSVIQRMERYRPSFRLVVRRPDGHRYLYQAYRAPSATTGTDLLDLKGHLTSAMLVAPCDDTADCAFGGPRLVRAADLDALATLIEQSPAGACDANASNAGWSIVLAYADGSDDWLYLGQPSPLVAICIDVPLPDLQDTFGGNLHGP
jgi:hypothetical protein